LVVFLLLVSVQHQTDLGGSIFSDLFEFVIGLDPQRFHGWGGVIEYLFDLRFFVRAQVQLVIQDINHMVVVAAIDPRPAEAMVDVKARSGGTDQYADQENDDVLDPWFHGYSFIQLTTISSLLEEVVGVKALTLMPAASEVKKEGPLIALANPGVFGSKEKKTQAATTVEPTRGSNQRKAISVKERVWVIAASRTRAMTLAVKISSSASEKTGTAKS
jgi:hypothetical protein